MTTETTIPGRDPMFGRRAALPYGGTTGHSGSDASRERAEMEAEHGISGARQIRILALLEKAGPTGLTWVELGRSLDEHHGQVSSSLSVLHKMGEIVRLKDVRRDRSSVYVLSQYLDGRETAKPRTSKEGALRERIAALETELRAVQTSFAESVQNVDRALALQQQAERDKALAYDLMKAMSTETKDEIVKITEKYEESVRYARTLRAMVDAGLGTLSKDDALLVEYLETALGKAEGRPNETTVPCRLGTLRGLVIIIRRLSNRP